MAGVKISAQTEVTSVSSVAEIALNVGGDGRRADAVDTVYSMTYQIPVIIETPQGQVAYHDVHAMTTGTSVKIEGMIMPSGVDSTFNWKIRGVIPSVLPTTPVYTLRTTYKAQGSEAASNILLTVSYTAKGDGEDIDVALSGEGQQTVAAPTVLNTLDVFDQVLDAAAIGVADFVFGQIFREGTAGGDTLTQDIQIVGMVLIITAG